MTMQDFAGNSRAVETVGRLLETGRFPPSLMFVGPKGVGKFTLATMLARAANCAERSNAEPCGACDTCRALAALDNLNEMRQQAVKDRGSASPEVYPLILRPHPNVTVLVPDGTFIRVSQMRYVVRHAYTTPAGHGRMFFLIDQAERLRGDLADILLKVLEEPPPLTTLVLITSEPFRLRATVRSRCVQIHFGLLTREEISGRLRALRPGWKAREREIAAAAGAGSLGRAAGLDLDEYRQIRSAALQVLDTTEHRKDATGGLFEATAELAGRSKSADTSESGAGLTPVERFDFVLEVIYSLVNDVLYLKSGQPKAVLRNPDLAKELEELTSRTNNRWVEETTSRLDQIASLQRRNVNRQLSLDSLALRPAGRGS